MKKIVLMALGLVAATAAWSAGDSFVNEKAHNNIRSKDSLRRGAQTYMNYCLGCHSMDFQRYNRVAKDLELTEDEMMESLVLTDAKFVDKMEISMTKEQGDAWFGKAGPDLTVIAKARGVDWLFSYLVNFYQDENQANGWNNLTLPNAAMPHILWEMQGIQKAHFEEVTDEDGNSHKEFKSFEKVVEGRMNDTEYRDMVRDLVNFLDYSSEPAKLIRMDYAPWVLLFVSFFTFLAYLLKVNYFRDVH